MIAIIDYGSGNVQAIGNVYRKLRIPFIIASRPDELLGADRLILPGVGAFDQVVEALEGSGMRAAIEELVIENHKLILGICVGMQLLANYSEEGEARGLGWINGMVKRFQPGDSSRPLQLPHMGWNTVEPVGLDPLLEKVDLMTGFYFLHSYHFVCRESADQSGTTDYGIKFASTVRKRNIYGVQFHPEKSHQAGVQLLTNFANLPIADD